MHLITETPHEFFFEVPFGQVHFEPGVEAILPVVALWPNRHGQRYGVLLGDSFVIRENRTMLPVLAPPQRSDRRTTEPIYSRSLRLVMDVS